MGKKTITYFGAKNSSLPLWVSVLITVIALVTRIVYYCDKGRVDFLTAIVFIILPVAANLFIAIRLPLKGEKHFYLTVNPVVAYQIYFCFAACTIGAPLLYEVICCVLCAVQLIAYTLTFAGVFKTRALAFSAYLIPLLFAADPLFRYYFALLIAGTSRLLIVSNVSLYLSLIFMLIAAKPLPKAKPAEVRYRLGDRCDGRLVRSLDPISKLAPFFMPRRNGANNLFSEAVEITPVERYIHQKRREGLKHFGFVHVLAAAYVRTVAEYPGINRFISGQKIYKREDVIVSMAVKKEMSAEGMETIIKVHLKPEDTAADVYRKYDKVVQDAKVPEEKSAFDKVIYCINFIPSLVKRLGVDIINLMDYLGIFPFIFTELSPFHGSIFITSMGSLGIPPIYHHLYDFGNIPVFCSFGCKRTVKSVDEEGNLVVKKYIDYKWVSDERIVDGFYYAMALKKIRYYMNHPECLDEPHAVASDVD